MRVMAFIVFMLCVAVVARAQEIRFDFEPPTPVPETAYQETLQREGDRWRWRAIDTGPATIRVKHRGDTVLSQEVQALAEPTHHVILRVVRVTPDWHAYVHDGGGWPAAVPVKESESLKPALNGGGR